MLLLISAIALAANTAQITADIEVLSGISPTPDGLMITSRNIHHPDLTVATQWVANSFADIPGISVNTEFFVYDDLELANIIAELPGTDSELPPIVVGAHLDSIANQTPDWNASTDPAPGADDNASGVAAVLDIARQLAAQGPLQRTVWFVCFSAEEYGLVGSEAYVENLVAEQQSIQIALIIDPAGYNPGDFIWFSYDPRWPDAAQFPMDVATTVEPYQVMGVDATLIGDDRSDHASFWNAEIPALHFGTYPLSPAYHTVDDTMDGVDSIFTSAFSDLVTEVVLTLSPPTPEESVNSKSCGCETGSSRLEFAVVGALALLRRTKHT